MATKRPFYPKRSKKQQPKSEAFTLIKVYVPRGTARIIADASDTMNLPMSRIIAISIDNELDAPKPFTYLIEEPKAPYMEYAYVDEASRLLKFIQDEFPTGATLQSIMLCRRDFKIPNRNDVMLAYRELLNTGLVETFIKPNRMTGNSYELVRAVEDPTEPVELKSRAKRPVRRGGVDNV